QLGGGPAVLAGRRDALALLDHLHDAPHPRMDHALVAVHAGLRELQRVGLRRPVLRREAAAGELRAVVGLAALRERPERVQDEPRLPVEPERVPRSVIDTRTWHP